MLYLILAIALFIGFWHLIITRKINPDHIFVKRMDPIAFTHISISNFSGRIRISPKIGDNFRYRASGKISYSINNGYRLPYGEFSFEIDDQENIILNDLVRQQSMLIGKIDEKTYNEHFGTDLYRVRLPEEYKGQHEYTRGLFPYYVPIQFTMMTSGGNKYSHQERTIITSPKGDTLLLYQNYGHMDSGEKSGIFGK
ncbi:hypothetical protein [Flagellimonas okinawensis]|uniref:Uncharacterized protein n=1 Tax=Flagellimonas okinawensis TaxID=3031324 RepID=A0ABT5XIG3_9FLAO|nr:hypothetical protein [[Muricauda] okinawensis]MDF0705681.1 hypothetical protein [[Muricauda] okinawensis]